MGQPPLRPRIQVDSFEAVCLMAEADVGLGIAPESAARRYASHMRIAVVPLSDAWAVRNRFVVVREVEQTPLFLRDLVTTICEHRDQADSDLGTVVTARRSSLLEEPRTGPFRRRNARPIPPPPAPGS
ncbi:LysR substrate-binding domain-containing protein [Aquabacterium sp. A7-Y]|uniref:LysR substrate-binding domain-containing protein n=1 Tax=Aquabacterium sp. A7-Y TaxID=1349605 RepID=UPI0039FDD954